jgi:LuxR family maltose regulon positive regulatory protein
LKPHLGADAHLYGYWNEEVGLAQARWMLANDDHTTLADHLDALIASSEDNQRNGTLIQSLILKSLVSERQGQAGKALGLLERALHLAEPSGYVRTFIDEGPRMANLLSRPTGNSYAARLLQTMNTTPAHQPASSQRTTHPALVEALSDRELQILRLMAGRLSNNEIANELYLATTTIKWYSRQIYRKLGVHERREAAERGRALGLI